jgi:hypothetical protein
MSAKKFGGNRFDVRLVILFSASLASAAAHVIQQYL